MTTPKILDCGHEPSPHSVFSTGTMKIGKREICWTCADEIQREEMKTASSFIAYINSDGTQLITWSGGNLARVIGDWRIKHNMSRGMHYWRFRDTNETEWYGRNSGTGMSIHVHRAKNNW